MLQHKTTRHIASNVQFSAIVQVCYLLLMCRLKGMKAMQALLDASTTLEDKPLETDDALSVGLIFSAVSRSDKDVRKEACLG